MQRILTDQRAVAVSSRRSFVSALTGGFLRPQALRSAVVRSAKTELHLADTPVGLLTTDCGSTGFTFLSVHENEQTAVKATREVIGHRGGRLIEVQQHGQRLLSFRLNWTTYQVDPNRIFTGAGIEKSLRPRWWFPTAAQAAVATFRDKLLAKILEDHPRVLIAVHNNASTGLSAGSYQPGGQFEADAARVSLNPKLNLHDFFLVWEPPLFDRLRAASFNVVLQSAKPNDDGSLSVYCQQRHISYVNVEAGHGHLEEQIRMLDALIGVLQASPPSRI